MKMIIKIKQGFGIECIVVHNMGQPHFVMYKTLRLAYTPGKFMKITNN